VRPDCGGLPLPSGDGEEVHVLIPVGTRTRADGFHLHRTRNLIATDARIRDGLPVTSPARTTLDLTPAWTSRQLELGIDRLLVGRLMRLDHLRELVGRTAGQPGVKALRAVVEAHQGSTLTRSQAEELALELIRGANLPQPRTNAYVAGYEVDFHWPEHHLVVEIDGYAYHSTRRAFEHDRRKQTDLRTAGLTVLRFSYEQLRREPLVVIAAIARALAQPG
jgi:very-short-patch-repair endonuclease